MKVSHSLVPAMLCGALVLGAGTEGPRAGEPRKAPAGKRADAEQEGQGPLTPLTLEQAGLRARAARKALVVEIGTSWCGPCKILELQVLPHPAVRKALAEVVFVRYDAEAGPGRAAARALSVSGYPTLVARAQDGAEISRIQGVPAASELAQWLIRVAAESEPTEILEARVKKDPGDGRALLTLSRRYRKRGQQDLSRQMLLQALSASKGKDEATAANADWGLRMDHLQTVLREEPRKAMIEHLLHYPRGPMADAALQALSRLGQADERTRQALQSYIDAHLEPGQGESLNQAIYACLRASAYDEAERGARKLLSQDKSNAMYLDTLAEVLHMRGDSGAALKLEAEALASLPGPGPGPGDRRDADQATVDLRAELSRNQARFRRGHREPPADLAHESDEPFPWEQF